MSPEFSLIPTSKLTRAGLEKVPVQITRLGEKATWRFIEFFTANIRNKNTRTAYAHAVTQFFAWCEERRISLDQLRPAVIAAYIEQHPGSPPTVKQHLAAIRKHNRWNAGPRPDRPDVLHLRARQRGSPHES